MKAGLLAIFKGSRRSSPWSSRAALFPVNSGLRSRNRKRCAAAAAAEMREGEGGLTRKTPSSLSRRKQFPHMAHGGAWKVAYADFVTAMMAFFLVMWIVGQSRSVRAAVAGYFREPGIFDQQKSNGPLPGGEMRLGPNQANEDPSSKEVLKEAQQALEKAASRIKSLLASSPDLKLVEKQIEITVTRDGLRIELLEGSEPTFFASGSAALAPGTESVLALISRELGKLKNEVALEGHTDSQPYSSAGSYTNWELSADRANAARRIDGAERPARRADSPRSAATRIRRCG